MTHVQRFDPQIVNGNVFAPLSHGCASMLFFIDRSVFKKSLQEKATIYGFKKKLGKTKNHKFITQFHGSL